MSENDFSAWLGRSETIEEPIATGPARGVAAMLDDATTPLDEGAPLPPLWHWFYFLPRVMQSGLGPDGHPAKGGFMPPVPLPRRMFAGARVRFTAPLRLGGTAARISTIHKITHKAGGSGALVFITVGHVVRQDGAICVEEEQDIVYREAGGPVPVPRTIALLPPPPSAWSRVVTPDPVLLFRFSALTFNAHRIHYDRPYAMTVEGYPGLVVHGPLTATLLMELARHNATRPIAAFEFRGLAPLFDLAPFRLIGTLDGEERVALEAQGPDGACAMRATATLG